MSPLLTASDLTVEYATREGILTALHRINLEVAAGETVGLVGESGSGKSTLAKALLGLVAPASGSIRLEGTELVGCSAAVRRHHCRTIQMVFQNPDAALNPRLTVGRIIEEPLAVHRIGSRSARQARVFDLMRRVGLGETLAGSYPHQLSGGQKQRVSIARALTLEPRIIVADEAVSALDVSVRGQILNLFADLQDELGLAYLFISHDLAVVQQIAHRVVVLYRGQVVEVADGSDIWQRPLHPYTRELIDAVPIPDPGVRPPARPRPAGEPPRAAAPHAGCPYVERCAIATAYCTAAAPALRPFGAGRWAACHLAAST